MPGVTYRPIAYDQVPRLTRYDVICVHTIVGHDPAPAAHFSTGADGTITQSRDTVYQSAANLNGNYRVVAIENEDVGPEFGAWNTFDGHAVPGFTDAQCESIARICAWVHRTHGVPLTPCPNSRAISRGVAYHRQGIDGNWTGYAYGGRVVGGEYWSRSTGKVCPGDRRIRQLSDTIIPRAQVLAGLWEDDVTAREVWDEDITSATGYVTSARNWLWSTNARAERIEVQLAALAGTLSDDEANVVAAIRAQPTGGQVDVDALARALAPLLGRVPADQVDALVARLVDAVPRETRRLLGEALVGEASV